MTDQHTPDPLYVSRFATPDYAPEFGLYRGDEQSPLAIVRGDNAKANALVFAASFVMLDALRDLVADIEFSLNDIPLGCIGTRQMRAAKAAIAAATEGS